MDQRLVTTANLSVLHDWELTMIAMDRAHGTLRLGFKASDLTECTILFHRVVTQRINNVQCQNVVSRVLTFDSTTCAGGELERVLRWTFCGAEDKLLISEHDLRQHLVRMRSGELQLLYVEPSWGAEIGVLAERYQVVD